MRTRGNSPLANRSRRRTNIIPRLDVLEDRRLMAVAFVETPVVAPPGSNIAPYLVTHGSDGSVWTISEARSWIPEGPLTFPVSRTDSQGSTTLVAGLPAGDHPTALFAGDNGSVWVVTQALGGTGHVVKLTTNYNVIGSLPKTPLSATLGADGDIWVTASHAGNGTTYEIDRFDPRTGIVTSFALPDASKPLGPIIAATDGNLWIVEPSANEVAKISLAGQITEYPVAFSPWAITAGTAGGVWVAGSEDRNNLGIAHLTADGRTDTGLGMTPPIGSASTVGTLSLAAGPDDSLWFTSQSQSAIGHFKAGQLPDYFPLPKVGSLPGALTTDGGTGFYFIESARSDFVHVQTEAPDPTVLLTPQSIEHVEGPLPSGITIATFTTTDATAFPFDFIARYQVGNQAPQVGTVLSDGRGGFVVQTSGSDPTQQPGSNFLSVTVLDVKHNNSIGVKSSGIALVKIDEAPVTITSQTISATPGVAYTGPVATLSDPDGGTAADVPTQVTISWGDGVSSSVTVSPNAATATDLVVPGGHVYAYAHSYTITVTANHSGSISTVYTTVNVTIPAITSISSTIAGYSQGHVGEARAATFETASPSVAANYWGESYASPDSWRNERIVQVGPTSFEVWATADFSSWGEQIFDVYIEPNTGSWSFVQGDAIVTPAPITASVLPLSIGSDLGVYGFSSGLAASFTSGNPQAQASDYRATITSSDGGSWDSSVHSDGAGGFQVYGDHKFPTSATAGTFALAIKIDNFRSDGQVANAATLTENASVLSTPPLFGQPAGVVVQSPEGAGWVGTIGTFGMTQESAASGPITATIHWGDGSPDSAGQIGASGVYAGNEYATWSVAGGHVFTRPGTFSPTIDVVAADGEHTTITSTVQVIPPPFVATGSSLTGTQGTAISGVVATFHDATPSAPSAYSSTIDWGDGTLSPGTVSTYQDAFVVFGSHVYATAGPHAYGLVIQENGGTPVTATGTVMVAVADPIPKPVGTPPIGTPAGGGPVGGGPLTIVSARSIRTKRGSVRVVVTLSGSVDPASVTKTSQYVLTEPGKPGKHGTKDKIDKIAGATYDPSTKTLTLVPKGTFRRPVAFRVAVLGSASVLALAS